MNAFDLWLYRAILRRNVRQGENHPATITALYAEIRKAAEREFYEDNKPTRDDYLREWFEASL